MRLVQRIERLEALQPDPVKAFAELAKNDSEEDINRFVDYLREHASAAVAKLTGEELERLASGDSSFLPQGDRDFVDIALGLKVWEFPTKP